MQTASVQLGRGCYADLQGSGPRFSCACACVHPVVYVCVCVCVCVCVSVCACVCVCVGLLPPNFSLSLSLSPSLSFPFPLPPSPFPPPHVSCTYTFLRDASPDETRPTLGAGLPVVLGIARAGAWACGRALTLDSADPALTGRGMCGKVGPCLVWVSSDMYVTVKCLLDMLRECGPTETQRKQEALQKLVACTSVPSASQTMPLGAFQWETDFGQLLEPVMECIAADDTDVCSCLRFDSEVMPRPPAPTCSRRIGSKLVNEGGGGGGL